MKIRKLFFGGAFALSILGAFAFKAPAPKLVFNAALPTACATPIKDCPGGSTICSSAGTQLQITVNGHCVAAAYQH